MPASRKMGRKASWHLADISSAADRERMFDEFVAEHGRIDVLVNNAVSGENATFTEITEAMWDFQIGNALKGYVFCSQRAAREMIAQGSGGSIISISSVHSLRSWPEDAIYGIAKAGLNRMVLSMAVKISPAPASTPTALRPATSTRACWRPKKNRPADSMPTTPCPRSPAGAEVCRATSPGRPFSWPQTWAVTSTGRRSRWTAVC